MPSVVRSNLWFIRVDYPREHVEEKMKKILAWIDLEKILAVFHTGKTKENPHFHAIITLKSHSTIQKQSFDVRIKTIFDVKKGSYSSKVWDGQSGAASYLFHENTRDIIANRGYSQADLAEFEKLNTEVQKVVEINKEKGTNRSVDRLMGQLAEDCSRRQIFMAMMNEIKEGTMYHPGYRMSAVIDEIFIKKSSKEKFEEVMEYEWMALREKNKW